MNIKEIQVDINRRLANGESKSAVFQFMRDQGISDRKIARIIASYFDPQLGVQHARLIKAIIVIAWVQLALALLIALAAGIKMGLVGCLLLVAFIGAFAYLFVWGFTHSKAWAYNTTILLSMVNLPKALNGFTVTPIASSATLLIGIALLAFTWHVRSKLFPDFLFMSPKKVKGAYVFSS